MATGSRSCTVEIFQGLEPEERDSLLQALTRVSYRQGRILYMPNETGEVLFFVQSGIVQIYRISPEGKKFVLENLQAGAIFGEMALIGQHMHSSFAQALEDTVLCIIRREDLERLLLDRPGLALRLLEVMGRRLAEAEGRLEDMAFRSVAGRLASLLLRLSEDSQNTVEGFSHQDLAEMVGAYRETVTQALNDFKAARLVDVQRKRILILKPEDLRAIATDGSRELVTARR